MSQRSFFSTLLVLWLASRASADGGDDFANNLASDLGPIFALFGERVVMQFMSQAMGIADCILLAVAPIGAITTVVSAIRVAGPPWLKSFIGRARENLAAAEVEVMSSTSTETCELWNGHSVIRCPGSADICQFICLIPKKYGVADLKQKKIRIRCEKLKDIVEDAETLTNRDKDGARGIGTASKLLQKKKLAGPIYIWQCFKNSVRLFSGKLRRVQPPDVEKQDKNHPNIPAETPESSSSNKKTSVHNSETVCSKDEENIELVVVMDNLDGSAPNLLLNCHDRVGRSEIYAAAAFGVILQLGAIAYFAFITYHKSIRNRFPKDGKRVVEYAFPCAAIGTILLVFGLFICSWVVGKSTKETYYEAENHKICMVWIQKDHTVSDQVFKPYAIYPILEQKYITTSRRDIEHHQKELRTLVRNIFRRLFKEKAANSTEENGKQETVVVKNPLYWPLKFITFIGALTSLIGFISQFIGMRGLNWTASVVQLGITITLTMLRAIVRRGLGKPPAYTSLTRGYELDWFILSLGDPAKAPWAPSSLEPINSDEKKDGDSTATSATSAEKPSRWEIRTGDEQVYLPLNDVSEGSSQSVETSVPHEIMLVRKKLGKHSKWKSPVLEEAVCLSRAIEIVANTFLRGVNKTTTKYAWSVPARYTKKSSKEFDENYIYVTITKDEQGAWQVDEAAIEAILSLWLFSTSSMELSTTNRQSNLRLYGSSQSEKRLIRDLKWWMLEKIPEFSKTTEDKIAKLTNERNGYKTVGFRTERDGAERLTNTAVKSEPTAEYLVLESQDEKQRLFSRDLFFSFIRAVAKTPGATIANVSSEYLSTYMNLDIKWSQMKFKSEAFSEMVRKLENIGLGTLSDIYIDLLVPLSLEQKLPNVKDIIDEAMRQASTFERSRKWKKLVDTCLCLPDLALNFDFKTESSSPRAIALCLGFLHRLHHEARLQKSEGRIEEDFTSQLKIFTERFNQERAIQSLTYFTATPPDVTEFFAVSLSTLGDPDYMYNSSFPKSFEIAAETREAVQKIWSERKLHIPDIKILEKTDAFGWSLLHYAAPLTLDIDDSCQMSQMGDKSMFPNTQDLMGWTPLHHACFFGNVEMVKMLLKYKTLIEIAGNDGITPMHCAVQSGNTETLQVLVDMLKEKRKTNTRKSKRHVDRNQRHPIHWAAVKGNVEMFTLMEDDMGLKDRFGWTPLHLAAIYGHQDLLQHISETHNEVINAGDNIDLEGRTPLYLSVEHGEIETINVLLKAGANVKTARKDGRTPLHVALSRGKDGLEVAKILLRAGADVNTKALDGATGLHIAAQCGTLFEILDFLPDYISKSLDTDATDVHGQTPLLIAIYEKEWVAARLLLDMGADVNADKRSGYTPVLGAVVEENEDILRKLLDKGARVDDADEDGFSALHLAILNDNQSIVQALLDANADVNAAVSWRDDTPLHITIRLGQIQNIQTLLDKGAKTTVLNFRGFSPLQQALYSGYLTAVQILVEHDKKSAIKAALQKNKEGDTPLHTLATYAHTRDEDTTCKMLGQLLSIGPEIDINAKTTGGYTPLDFALFQGIRHRQFITQLLESGAEPGSEFAKRLLRDWRNSEDVN